MLLWRISVWMSASFSNPFSGIIRGTTLNCFFSGRVNVIAGLRYTICLAFLSLLRLILDPGVQDCYSSAPSPQLGRWLRAAAPKAVRRSLSTHSNDSCEVTYILVFLTQVYRMRSSPSNVVFGFPFYQIFLLIFVFLFLLYTIQLSVSPSFFSTFGRSTRRCRATVNMD